MGSRRLRVLLGKPGLDGHDRGVKVLAHALREAGLEVVYTGLHQTVERIVAIAIQEDVDVVGVSILSGVHMTVVPELLAALRAQGAGEKKVVVGGFIPEPEERAELERAGAAKVLDQDRSLDEMVAVIRALAEAARDSDG
jgi:methylmalonyl-CoA mutase C-terminal domain/subunit